MKKVAVLFAVLCACGGSDSKTQQDAGIDAPMIDAPPTGCQAASDCDDSNPCTTDTCSSSHTCAHAAPAGLDDGVDCTEDACDMSTGAITHTVNNGMCDDGVACSTDVCDPTAGCTHTADNTACNDNVDCTTDTCDVATGCVFTPVDTACDDGVDCTVDSCSATTGCGHTAMDNLCELDGKSCTVPTCSPTTGCSEAPTDAMCNDNATCSTDTCDPTAAGANATTGCVYQLDNAMCADTAECSIDPCAPGTGGADPTTGCAYTPDPAACDSNATCTSSFDCACNAGYTGSGLTCSGVTCDALSNPTNGTVTITNGGLYPSTATFACSPGFAPTATQRTCGTDGHWSGTAVTCEATFFVVRVGDGSATLSTAATPVFVEERFVGDGSLVRTITLPTTANGAQAQLTASGTATSEGGMTRSTDGRYVVLAGYAADAGTAAVANTANLSTGTGPVNRVVGRIDTTGAIDTSTRLVDAFTGITGTAGNPRGVASADGTAFWVTGTSSSTPIGGMFYVTLGSTGTAVHLEGSNIHQTGIFDGQLYESSTSAVEAVGTGLPTTSPQVPASVAATTSARAFAFVDTDATAGVDMLFIAIDANSGTTGVLNIQKWTLVGTTWTKDTSFAPALAGVTGAGSGVRGLTAWVDNGTPHIVATLAVSPGNRIVGITVDTETPTATVLATADTNTVFRGVALSPNAAP
jgi:hypothetical protein